MARKDNQRKKVTPEEMIRKIAENYIKLEDSYANQLGIATPIHQLTTGNYREEVWLQLFERMIPKKFCIAKGVFIVDSFGNFSAEVDIAIYDEQYTPYIFTVGNSLKFIPIEAVAVAIQCKSENVDNTEVIDWATTIKKLKTSLNAVTRLQTAILHTNLDRLHSTFLAQTVANAEDVSKPKPFRQTQTSTRPILILCKLNGSQTELAEHFDIILSVNERETRKNGEAYEMTKHIRMENEDLIYWYKELNHYDLKRYETDEKKLVDIANTRQKIGKTLYNLRVSENDKENTVLSLTFQLNQLLMLINNPIFFPHESYANMFQRALNEGTLPK